MNAGADAPPPPEYLVEPAALAAGSTASVGGHTLHWQPWARPVLLDAHAEAILAAFDGAPLDELVDALAEVQHRARDEVAAEMQLLVRHFAGHGLLVGSPQRPRWSPSAMNRPITSCDATAWNLESAEVLDVVVSGRRATCIVGDAAVVDALRRQGRLEVLDAPGNLGGAPIELILAIEDRPGGVHRLFGRAGRGLLRSTDRDEVVRSFFSHLDTLAWTRSLPEHLWLDAAAMRLPHGGVALVAGRARYDWARLGRPLQRAGIGTVEAALTPVTFDGDVPVTVEPPDVVDPDVAAVARACLGDDRPLRAAPSRPQPVTRVELIATSTEIDRLIAAGHDPDTLDAPLAAYRIALLAHDAALDRYPDEPPSGPDASAALQATVSLAASPEVAVAIRSQVAELVTALTRVPTAPPRAAN